MKRITVFTDGACSGNPGPGGYGVILRYNNHEKVISGGFRKTTNNRMELYAAIVALESLKEPCDVTMVTDSQYLVHAVEKGWLRAWKAKDWRKSGKGRVLNIDLWERLLAHLNKHKVSFIWIRGHAGHAENERCDAMAVAASLAPHLPEDSGY
ncbi:MAG: ribonuclease HI [Chitinispirillaceae bacterium]|nr:ribonuclease HI [Chitinispirillaceae bacterium]